MAKPKHGRKKKKPTGKKKKQITVPEYHVVNPAKGDKSHLPGAEALLEIHGKLDQFDELVQSSQMQTLFHELFKKYERDMAKAVQGMPKECAVVAEMMRKKIFQTPNYEATFVGEIISNMKVNFAEQSKGFKKSDVGAGVSMNAILGDMLDASGETPTVLANRIGSAMIDCLVSRFKENVEEAYAKALASRELRLRMICDGRYFGG